MCWRREHFDELAASELRREIGAFVRLHAAAGSDVASAELIIGELLANVARYAAGPACVDLDWSADGEPTLVVHDAGPGFLPSPQLPSPVAEAGRGWYLIAVLARRLTAERVERGGMRVSATLPVRGRRPPDAVPCPLGTPFRRGASCPFPVSQRRGATRRRSVDVPR